MAPSKREAGQVGLRLNEPGHPNTWRHFPDQDVWLHYDHDTPCGGAPHEPTEAFAKKWAGEDGSPAALVDLKNPAKSRAMYENHLRETRGLPPVPASSFEGAALDAQKSTTQKEA